MHCLDNGDDDYDNDDIMMIITLHVCLLIDQTCSNDYAVNTNVHVSFFDALSMLHKRDKSQYKSNFRLFSPIASLGELVQYVYVYQTLYITRLRTV